MSITHHLFRLRYAGHRQVKICNTPETEAMGIGNCRGVVKDETPQEYRVYVLDNKTKKHHLHTIKKGWVAG